VRVRSVLFAAGLIAVLSGVPASGALAAADPPIPTEAEVERVLDEVRPSVVTVVSRCASRSAHGRGDAPSSRSVRVHVGSGVVYDDFGHIVTTASVADEDDEISVETMNGQRFPARLIARDPTANVSLLEIGTRGLRPLAHGSSSALVPGSQVVLVGYSAGSSTPASALGSIREPFAVSGLREGQNVLTVDAAVRRGWSGGAVVNTEGRLVGLVAGRLDPRDVLTRAPAEARVEGRESVRRPEPGAIVVVTVEQLQDVVAQVVVDDAKDRGFLGVRIVGLTPYLRTVLGAGTATRGVAVAEVIPDAPAERAGLRSGDVIVRLGGSEVGSVAELTRRVAHAVPGTSLDLGVLREGQPIALTAEIGRMPEPMRRAEAMSDTQSLHTDRRKFLQEEIRRLEEELERYHRELQIEGRR